MQRWNTLCYSLFSEEEDVAIYPLKIFIKSNKCKETPRDFVETLKNYASYIHTFSLTDKGEKEKKILP